MRTHMAQLRSMVLLITTNRASRCFVLSPKERRWLLPKPCGSIPATVYYNRLPDRGTGRFRQSFVGTSSPGRPFSRSGILILLMMRDGAGRSLSVQFLFERPKENEQPPLSIYSPSVGRNCSSIECPFLCLDAKERTKVSAEGAITHSCIK